MPVDIVVDLYFGDNAKGKLVDFLAPDYEIIARFNGGNNCGHKLTINGFSYTMSLIPSGIFYPDKICVLGNGVLINPQVLKDEIKKLEALGVSFKNRFFISNCAHIITQKHIDIDREKCKNIGTTGKGIGPCVEDKVGRRGLRMGEVTDPELEPYITDACLLINEHLDRGSNILCEAGQGTFLDPDFGSYPYVTSTNTIAGAACVGLGFGPTKVKEVIGITKAYMTRVGNGPFKTELLNETGNRLRELGHEYGSVTGRPRRCGWLDMPLLKRAIMINGATQLCITKLDVLDTFDKIPVCDEYEKDGSPHYIEMDGWRTSTNDITENPPENMKRYLDYIEKETNVFIKYASTGPERNSMMLF